MRDQEQSEATGFPVAPDAENALLGCMLNDMTGLYDLHGPRLKDELFHLELQRIIAHAMIDMHVSAMPVDVVTVGDWLRKSGDLERIGGRPRLTELLTCVPFGSAGMAASYIPILEGMAARRMLLKQSDALRVAAFDYSADWKDCLLQAEGALFDAHSRTSHNGMQHVSKILPKVIREIEETVNRKGHVTNGVATGFTSFDRMTMGLKAGLHIIAARPSRGKTAVLMQMALHISMGFGDYPEFDQAPLDVGIFSLETDDVSLVKRGLLNLAALNMQRVRDGQMSRAQQDALKQECVTGRRVNNRIPYVEARLHVEASYMLSIQDFRSRLRMLVKRLGLRVVFVDYLQLMTSSSKRARDNRNLEIAEISVGLKQAALELGIPIIVLAQLNRDGDVGRPKLSHLRECGQIEQDADSVSMICDAPEWAGKDDPEDAPWKYVGIDLVKQKDGPTTSDGDPLVLRFDKEFFRLTSVDEKLFSNSDEQRQASSVPRDKNTYDRQKGPRGRPRKDAGPSPWEETSDPENTPLL
jgi:replicative DNA helicase